MIGFSLSCVAVAAIAQTDPGVNVDIGVTNGLLGGAVTPS